MRPVWTPAGLGLIKTRKIPTNIVKIPSRGKEEKGFSYSTSSVFNILSRIRVRPLDEGFWIHILFYGAIADFKAYVCNNVDHSDI